MGLLAHVKSGCNRFKPTTDPKTSSIGVESKFILALKGREGKPKSLPVITLLICLKLLPLVTSGLYKAPGRQ